MLRAVREINVGWKRTALLAFIFAAPVFAIALIRTNVVFALTPLLLSHLMLLYATLVANCAWWGPVVREFETQQPEVWITIDDGPCPVHTPKILDTLDQYGARATFFVVGRKAENHPRLITEILTRGHEIANHTFTHPSGNFWAAGPGAVAAEIEQCAEVLRTCPEKPARLFRAPAGLKNPFVHPELRRKGLALIGWTVRGFDTWRRDPANVAAAIAKKAKPGAIVVLHEAHRIERDPDFNPRCVELTLAALADAGYRFVIPTPEQLRLIGAGK